MGRHERHMRESTMTMQDAIELEQVILNSRLRWPSKRFRVEGTAAGNSRLLNRDEAFTAQSRFGGRVVELIRPRPESHATPRRWKNKTDATGMPKCPKCSAAEGAPCTRPSGQTVKPHRRRMSPTINMPACQKCGAPTGAPCTRNGKTIKAHRCRMTQPNPPPALGPPIWARSMTSGSDKANKGHDRG